MTRLLPHATLLAATALMLLAPAALAQTTANPVLGAYHEVYIVAGRALDSEGNPVAGGRLIVDIEQRGVEGRPVIATANCKGDFITYFNLRHAERAGRAVVTLVAAEGGQNVTVRAPLEPFWRRTDVIVELDRPWEGRCEARQDVFEVSASLVARILNRTDTYQAGGFEYEARPYTGIIRLRFMPPDGQEICPPHPQSTVPGECELFQPDERGDVRYTFTLDQPFDAGGVITVILQDGTMHNVTVDPETRIARLYLETSGQGAPKAQTPGAGAPLALVAVAGVALCARRLLGGRPR